MGIFKQIDKQVFLAKLEKNNRRYQNIIILKIYKTVHNDVNYFVIIQDNYFLGLKIFVYQ